MCQHFHYDHAGDAFFSLSLLPSLSSAAPASIRK
jgi:hypothetical protein